jgi:hypothetical protein
MEWGYESMTASPRTLEESHIWKWLCLVRRNEGVGEGATPEAGWCRSQHTPCRRRWWCREEEEEEEEWGEDVGAERERVRKACL